MKELVIRKTAIHNFLKAATKAHKVFAPMVQGGNVLFGDFSDGKKAMLDYLNSKISPKGLFFPQTEVLFRYSGDEIREASVPKERRVLFGIRPCDAKSLLLLDKVFSEGDFTHPYYAQRRLNTVILSLACSNPAESCFCWDLGLDPASEEGADAIFIGIGNAFLVKVLTEKGESFIKPFRKFFKPAQTSDVKNGNKAVEKVRSKVKSREAKSASTKAGLEEKVDIAFDNPVWDEIHKPCLGCGVCTYVCPTCHCFDITDESSAGGGRRICTWDSCMYPLFTLHASGHNPRPSGKERMRQRIMHKFKYCPENLQEIFCVGCGRCVASCPVNLDIREVLTEIQNKR